MELHEVEERELRRISDDLVRYLTDRAQAEGVRSELTPEFLVENMESGVTKFFGVQMVVCDGDAPAMAYDEQEHAEVCFATYKQREKGVGRSEGPATAACGWPSPAPLRSPGASPRGVPGGTGVPF